MNGKRTRNVRPTFWLRITPTSTTAMVRLDIVSFMGFMHFLDQPTPACGVSGKPACSASVNNGRNRKCCKCDFLSTTVRNPGLSGPVFMRDSALPIPLESGRKGYLPHFQKYILLVRPFPIHRRRLSTPGHTRQRERQMRRFKSRQQAQGFLSVHGVVQNLFRVGRHLLRSSNYRLLRLRSFTVWRSVTAV